MTYMMTQYKSHKNEVDVEFTIIISLISQTNLL